MLRATESLNFFSLVLVSLITVSIPHAAKAATYTTNFPLTENPISEGGKWINGGTIGLDWTNVRATGGTPGHAFGTEYGAGGVDDDSTAVLAGSWGPNQDVQGTVFLAKSAS